MRAVPQVSEALAGLQGETTGKITLMNNDVNKLQDLFQLLQPLGAQIFIVASFVMLYDVIQWSSCRLRLHHVAAP